MTVQKECQNCGIWFVTRTANSARWERNCFDCYTILRNRKDFQFTQFEDREDMKLKSINKQIVKIQNEINALPSIVKGEVNSVLHTVVDADFLKQTKEEIYNQIFSLWLEKEKADKEFKDKIQRQLLTLNNKVLQLMKKE
jgi:hypothetical protein